MSDSEEEFEEQIRLEKLEAAKSTESNEIIEHGRVKKDEDGIEFEWDAKQKAWFPKISEDFIANYQMNYGSIPLKVETRKAEDPPPEVASDPAAYWNYYYGNKPPEVTDPNYAAWYAYYCATTRAVDQESSDGAPEQSDPAYPKWYYKQCYDVEPDESDEKYKEWVSQLQSGTQATETAKDGEGAQDGAKKSQGTDSEEPAVKKKKPDPIWFEQEEAHSTSVYVQGLPDDVTEDEFKDIMAKCGLIAYDYEKKKLKLKLYVDKETGKPKGDGLCTYIKRESVELAMQLVDESNLRGSTIEVQLAEFKVKGSFDPKLRRKPKNNKAKRREKEKQAKLLDWTPDKLPDERFPCEKTAVLKNLFDPAEFDKNPAAIQEVRADMRQECSNFGEIKKITIYDRNSEGVVTVTYKEFEEADLCVSSLNQRWFGGRRVVASNWNGKEKYEVKETAEQEAERLRKWDEYLESGGDDPTKT